MPTVRKHQVDLNITQYYHCISRCVRRAYLCGTDKFTGQNFNHRRQWLVDLMHQLSEAFAVQICAYAIMSNHYHLVLFVDRDRARSWSDQEVIERWARLFPMSKAREWLDFGIDLENLTEPEQNEILKWRDQLHDISWFMRKLNEYIARQANKEDDCTGRFWEGRFKSQALLDESALLACMIYVDLNPIRAGMSNTPESSDFTSIQERLRAYQNQSATSESLSKFEDEALEKDIKIKKLSLIPCSQLEYFELVDTTGRLVKHGKTGAIPAKLAPILKRVKINPDNWLDTVKSLGESFAHFIGQALSIEKRKKALGKLRLHGIEAAKKSFLTAA